MARRNPRSMVFDDPARSEMGGLYALTVGRVIADRFLEHHVPRVAIGDGDDRFHYVQTWHYERLQDDVEQFVLILTRTMDEGFYLDCEALVRAIERHANAESFIGARTSWQPGTNYVIADILRHLDGAPVLVLEEI